MLNHRIVLAEAPSGTLGLHHFRSVTTAVPPLTADQILIRVVYAQVPPAARAVMTNTTAFPMTQPHPRDRSRHTVVDRLGSAFS
jgi:NADPH-dependent curcumin reductase CurA